MQKKLVDELTILLWMRKRCNKIALLSLVLIFLCACAGQTERTNVDSSDRNSSGQPGNESSSGSAPSADDLDPDLLFHALAAERLSSAGNYIEAYGHAYEASLLSDNPDLARQAVSLAMQVGNWKGVVQSARRWQQLDEDSNAAAQLIILGLLNQGETEAAARELVPIIESSEQSSESRAEAWREATLLIASAEDDEDALSAMGALIERLPDADPSQALESRSLLLWQLGQAEAAFELARTAAQGSANVDRLIWAAQLAAANDDYDEALELYAEAALVEPENVQLALARAEVLRQMERGDEAIALLSEASPATGTLYTLGVYQFEVDELAAARSTWERLAALENPDDPLEHAYLTGFLAELLQLNDEALRWYEQVEEGPNVNRALLRRAGIQGGNGELMQARNLLRAVRLGGDQELIEQSWLSEAELLRNDGRADECVDVLTEVLREAPSSIWLLYSRALCAVDADRLELAEQDLRRIIQLDGDNAMALNALGYTLTDQTRRHSEALSLIQRALELQPDDPATLDSMGWVLYRMGRLDESIGFLRRAWELDENPEIGSHLAEVLFFNDQREEAMALMESLLSDYPDQAIVIETDQRLRSEAE